MNLETNLKTSKIVKNKKFDLCIIILFVIMITLPIFGRVFNLDSNIGSGEKRQLAPLPKIVLSYQGILGLPKAYESYFNDSFGFRNLLVKMNNKFKVTFLKESPSTNVLIGKNNWLFYSSSTDGKSIQDYEGTDLFSKADLIIIKNKYEKQQKYLESIGAHLIIVIAPNKSTIYPEFMPDSIKKGEGQSRLDQVIAYLKSNTTIDIVDLKAPLIKAKKDFPTYYMTDTHWNNYGALIGYTEIMKKVNKYYPNLKAKSAADYAIKSVKGTGGDLAVMISAQSSAKEISMEVIPKFPILSKVASVDKDRTVIFKVDDDKLPRLVMSRDSFTIALAPYLAEHFSKSVFIWNFKFNNEIIEKEHPGIVISEMCERYLDAMLSEN